MHFKLKKERKIENVHDIFNFLFLLRVLADNLTRDEAEPLTILSAEYFSHTRPVYICTYIRCLSRVLTSIVVSAPEVQKG